jgi:hypothetical protein
MNARPLVPLLIPLGALLAGCGSPGAIFVTKTSLAIADIDSTPAEMTFAMHRVEGFIAPRNQNGNTPPVLAHITSNRDLKDPEVRQVYATGTAAERLAGDYDSNNSECDICKKRQQQAMALKTSLQEAAPPPQPPQAAEPDVSPVIFTTSTTVGLRIGMSHDNIIDGLVLGYRRKEMSFVPSLAKDDLGNFRYPSLIAAINLTSKKDGKGNFLACQGFATGSAATKLAESDDVGLGCLDKDESVRRLLTASRRAEMRQHADITRALGCYVKLTEARRHAARRNAEMLGLVPPPSQELVAAGGVPDVKTARYAGEGHYAQGLLDAVVTVQKEQEGTPRPVKVLQRESVLRIHRDFVCDKPEGAAPAAEPLGTLSQAIQQ